MGLLGRRILSERHESVENRHLDADVEEEGHVEPRNTIVREDNDTGSHRGRHDDTGARHVRGVVIGHIIEEEWEREKRAA